MTPMCLVGTKHVRHYNIRSCSFFSSRPTCVFSKQHLLEHLLAARGPNLLSAFPNLRTATIGPCAFSNLRTATIGPCAVSNLCTTIIPNF